MSDLVWLITGASSGFGKYIATEALRRGHKVIATARKISSVEQLRVAGAAVLEIDVTWDDKIIAAKVEEANHIYGKITHVVNCAGYILEGAVEEAKYAFHPFSYPRLYCNKITKADCFFLALRRSTISSTPTFSVLRISLALLFLISARLLKLVLLMLLLHTSAALPLTGLTLPWLITVPPKPPSLSLLMELVVKWLHSASKPAPLNLASSVPSFLIWERSNVAFKLL
jgi:hypothetical protein